MWKYLIIGPVRLYQKCLSPLLPASCRYVPTCPNYMLQAVEKHGLLKGTLMGIARILRCHPLARGGFDPVPEHFSLRRNTQPTDAQLAAFAHYLLHHQHD